MWHFQNRLKDQRGSVIVFVAVLLLALLGLAALAVDVGYLSVARSELQNVSDAASLAATRQLGSIYESMSYTAQQSYVCDPTEIIPVAQNIASQNEAAGKDISIREADIVIGKWDGKTNTFTPTLDQPDSVRVTARRDDTSNGPVQTFFGKFLKKDHAEVSAWSTAALTSQSTIDPGNLIPVGVSEAWFRNKQEFCDQVIKFYPANDPEGCAGWHTYMHSPSSESYLTKYILKDWATGTFAPPRAAIGDLFSFTGGTLGNQTFTAFLDLFNYMKTRDDDGNPDTWTAQVVVYEGNDCTSPNGERTVLGFATVNITAVVPPNIEITAKVICENIEPGRGSGGEYGTKGSIPGLVQ